VELQNVFGKYKRLIAEQYPDYAAWDIETMAIDMDVLNVECNVHELMDYIENRFLLEEEPYIPIRELSAPNGYIFLILTKGEEKPVLVLIKNDYE